MSQKKKRVLLCIVLLLLSAVAFLFYPMPTFIEIKPGMTSGEVWEKLEGEVFLAQISGESISFGLFLDESDPENIILFHVNQKLSSIEVPSTVVSRLQVSGNTMSFEGKKAQYTMDCSETALAGDGKSVTSFKIYKKGMLVERLLKIIGL